MEITESSRLEFLEKFLANNIAKIANVGVELLLLGTLCNLRKVTRAKFLGSDRLFCFVSTCNFNSFGPVQGLI